VHRRLLRALADTLLPAEPVQRALTFSNAAASLATGLFYSVSALYFTRVVGLAPATVGLGLTVAGAVGVASSFAGGYAADRFGADRVQVWANGVQAAALLTYVWAGNAVAFTLIACLAVGGRSLQSSAKAALLASWFTGVERVGVRARLRVVTNVFIGLGTCFAAVALLLDTAGAYRTTVVAVAVLAGAATVPLAGLRARVPGLAVRLAGRIDDEGVRLRGPSPLRDRTYLTTVALNSVIAMQFGLQTVGVPLWIATATDAPTVLISVLLVVNTAFVALFQVRASRGTDEVARAGRVARRGSLLLGAACLLYAGAGSVGTLAAVAVLLVAGLLGSWAEVWCEAGGWGLAFELADPRSAGAYQGLAQTGYALANMAAPAVVTVTAVDHGFPGWVLLGALFVAAGVAVGTLARRAARSRGSVESVDVELAA
jgi:hypothetical protein